MIAIFNLDGKVIGWIDDSVVIDMNNQCRAFIDDNSVFSYNGNYLGEFNGFFWNKNGSAVAFIEGASDGPMVPITEIEPIPPVPPIPPVSPVQSIPSVPPVHSLSWAETTFEDFLLS